MLISVKWLQTFVSCHASPEEIASKLTMAGLEVEGMTAYDPGLDKVVVGEIVEVLPHPDADHLSICKVRSSEKSYQIVCGAPNVAVGQVVPLALEGARLPTGRDIQATEIRGVLSEGMLCSEAELNLGEDASGIMVLPAELSPGTSLVEALDLHDVILEIGITPNRGDCLSVAGIAREVAALFQLEFSPPSIELVEHGPPVHTLAQVAIEDADLCPRYAARVVKDIKVRQSPFWLRQRLQALGIRAINNIVDVTNYVMLELGQPLHAFDYQLLDDHRIVVRRARPAESFVTLDGSSHTLSRDMLLICDGSRGVALAGVMGGLNSEISVETTDVLIESAYFQPASIRRTARALGVSTESSYRFERGVDPEGVITALDRAAQLMTELGQGVLARGRIDVYPRPFRPPSINLRVSKTNRFLGLELSREEIIDLLTALQLQVDPRSDDLLQVQPPSFRPDLTREVDLMEEVARLAGYDRIPSSLPRATITASKPPASRLFRERAKEVLANVGFSEVISYSFISSTLVERLRFAPDDRRLRCLPIRNPLSEDQSVMRTTLVPGLLEIAARNQRRNNFDLKLFELSKVFFPRSGHELPEERLNLAGLLGGLRRPLAWSEPALPVDFFDAKGAVEALLVALTGKRPRFQPETAAPYLKSTTAARIMLADSQLGDVGELHPEVLEDFRLKGPLYLFDLDFDLLASMGTTTRQFQPLPKFPAIRRDLAIVIPVDLPAQAVLDFLEENLPEQAESVLLFDHYRGGQVGAGKKSIAFRITYRSPERSLTDEEVNDLHAALTQRVLTTFQASLRT
ncbi:MAG: phenylalanine--tRNA ligase subunit beta [Deltaproteobacteria bacterium]|nr:phenylalanine--tRNA ligase subunit beta [Deltaproteobacteria bacterium]MBW2072444.1 phenylalanine--tRNA ligase subunit beta [Deltaproteobacteria bacterium]